MRLQEYLCFASDIAVFVAKICQNYYHGVKTFVNSLSVPMGIFSTFFFTDPLNCKHVLTFFTQRRHFSEIQRFWKDPEMQCKLQLKLPRHDFSRGTFSPPYWVSTELVIERRECKNYDWEAMSQFLCFFFV